MGIGWALEFSVGCWCCRSVYYTFGNQGLLFHGEWVRTSSDHQKWSQVFSLLHYRCLPCLSTLSVVFLFAADPLGRWWLSTFNSGCQFQGIRVLCSRKQKGPPFHGHFSTPWAALATSSCVGPADLMSWSRTKPLKTNVFRWIRQHQCVPSEEPWEGKGYVNKLVFKKVSGH